MEKQRNIKLISIIVLVVGVLGVTIAFALLSKSLVVSGGGNVSPTVFDIHFKAISEARITGKAEVINNPTINSEKKAEINNLEVLLKEPQDKIEYTVYIENSSDMNAKIEEITYPTLTEEESKIFKFSAKYEKDGSPMQVGDLLYKRQVKKVIITIEYLDITDKNLLPKEEKKINIDFKIKYVQDNKEYVSFEKDKATLVLRNSNWFKIDYPIENGEYNIYLNISDFNNWTNNQKNTTCRIEKDVGVIPILNTPKKVSVSEGKIRLAYSPSLSGKFGEYTQTDKILSNFEKYLVIEKAN